MSNDKITGRAFRMYNGYNPKYFPMCFLQQIFSNISFYFRIWMSAEIVNGLYEGREKRELYFLVIITLAGSFLLRVLAAALNREVGIQREILSNQEAAAFYRKTLSLDYDKMENPDIRNLRRQIQENKKINWYGTENMRIRVEQLMECFLNIIFSLILFADMIAKMAAVPFQWFSLVLLAALALSLAGVIFFQFRQEKKSADYVKASNEMLLRENRLSMGHSPAGTDNRIYRQQGILNEIQRKINKEHRQINMNVNKQLFRLDLPIDAFRSMIEWCAYLIVCYYCRCLHQRALRL